MKLTLDHTQRLNLHALLGAQRGDIATIRAVWALQDKIALTPEEEAAVELKREIVAGQERVIWNPALSIPVKDLDFTEPEISRARIAIETWGNFGVAPDRFWLQPFIEALFVNGREPQS